MGRRVNRIDEAQQRLYNALQEVLPGRVSPYPPSDPVGPAIWIEQPTITPNRVGQATVVYVDFPVWIGYDGADHAQIAGLNDATARVWDVVERLGFSQALGARPPGRDPAISSRERAQVITVRMFLEARSFCLPDSPGESPIPPVTIQEASDG